jgi:hypothetical protein
MNNPSPRRKKAYVSTTNLTQLHLRNPWIVAIWSLLFPGLGHLLLAKYLRGYILFIWEIVINLMAHVNLAIFYSLTGRIELAKATVDKRWALLYIPTYIFAVWDSFRTTVDLNHQYVLAAREDADIQIFRIDSIEINYINKIDPRAPIAWSLLMPGMGQIAIHKIPEAFFILIWWIVIAYFSNVLPAIQFTLTGAFSQVAAAVNPQWLLNIPSIYMFALFAAYGNSVETNNLFDWEQSKYLNLNYQNSTFLMPSQKTVAKGDRMYIISSFEHSVFLESAITEIEMKGVAKEDILAVPLDKRVEDRQLFDTLHRSDGVSMLDVPLLAAALTALLGSVYGFIWAWGPIIWGCIGAVTGFCLGLIIKSIATRKFRNGQKNKKSTEVVLIIECKEALMDIVREALWANHALGVRKLALGNDGQ